MSEKRQQREGERVGEKRGRVSAMHPDKDKLVTEGNALLNQIKQNLVEFWNGIEQTLQYPQLIPDQAVASLISNTPTLLLQPKTTQPVTSKQEEEQCLKADLSITTLQVDGNCNEDISLLDMSGGFLDNA